MSFQTGNRMFSGSAGEPAHYPEHSTAQRHARGLPTGWGNDHRCDDRSAEQPGQHSHHSSAQRPAGFTEVDKISIQVRGLRPMMQGVSLKWTTSPSKWKDVSPICAEHLQAAPLMQVLATRRETLREIPWRGILEHVLTTAASRMGIPFDAPKLLSAVVEAAGMSSLEHLTSYLHDWRATSERVQAVLDWQTSPKEMCERSRPGAFLADCMITELKVREQGSRSSVHYHVVGNGEYQAMGHEMGIVNHEIGNNSANNVGNQLECLCWVALEEDRPEWIIALVWHALRLQLTPRWSTNQRQPSDSDAHPAHEPESDTDEDPAPTSLLTEPDNEEPLQPTARTAEGWSTNQRESSDSDAHPAHEPESDNDEDPAPTSLVTEPDNEEPLQPTLTTPLWDRFLENLQCACNEEKGRDFANFIQHHCFREDHFFKDSYGRTVDTKIPLAVKMESLFQTAWHQRKLALKRLRQKGVQANDETYELNDNDMRTLP